MGFSDAAQVLRACDAGGRLLQPSRALTAVDGAVARRALGARVGADAPPAGAVLSATYTLLPGGWAWDHVLAANLSAPFSLRPGVLAPTRADAALQGSPPPPPAALAYALNTTSLDVASLVVAPFSEAQPITLAANGLADFALWHTAPAFGNGWSLLGELGKWVPVSEARFGGPVVSGACVAVALRGAPGERVDVTWVHGATGAVAVARCVLDAAGGATATVDSGAGAGC